MKCPHCKEQIKRGAKRCPHCQGKIGMSAGGCLGAFVFVAIIIAVVVFIIPAVIGSSVDKEEAKENISKYSESQYKSKCSSYDYNQLAKSDDALSGEFLTYEGVVIQEVGNDFYRMKIDAAGRTIVFTFEGERILEGEYVTIWGQSIGFYEGETVDGDFKKLPHIYVGYVELS